MNDLEDRLTAAFTDTARRNLPDGTTPPPFRRPAIIHESPGRIRSWAVPALAAAVVVALAVGVVMLTNPASGNHGSSAAANRAVGTYVTLRTQTKGLSAAELQQARQVIAARAAALGSRHADVRVVGSDEITAFLPGVTAGDVAGLGAVDAVEFRPLITEPISSPAPKTSKTIVTGPAPVVDPWASLGFPPPTDAAAYNALNPNRQNAVRAVLHGWNCFDVPLDRTDAPIVVCDQGRTMRYLLGPAIFPPGQINSAAASPPSAGQVGWQVIVGLKATGQRLWSDYTAKHNESEHPGDLANQVATTVDGEVMVASTIQSTINGNTSVAGNFTSLSANLLAANLTGGVLPAPFDVVSARPK